MRNNIKLFCILFSLFLTVVSNAQNKTNGRVRLKKNIVAGKIILDQEMMKEESTTYVIKYAFDLNGKTLIIPKGCNLEFKRKGCISNGTIIFSGTWLKGERFQNLVSANGTVLNTLFDASRYGFIDDTDKLKFLFSQAKDGFSLKLESKLYRINSLKGVARVRYDSAFASFVRLKDISIIGKNTIVEDESSKSLIGNYLYSVLQFDACQDVKVKGISFVWSEEATLHPKVEGIVFLRTFNQCKHFDVDISVRNAGRAIYSGRWNDVNDPGRGICDSKLAVIADHVGYPIAIEKGDNLDIQNRFDYAHRGSYLAGVTNSKVYVEGKEAYSTRVNLLLTDASDKNGTYFCDNIDATVIDAGSKEMMTSVIMAQCNTYPQSYEQFKGRKPYKVESIRIKVHTPLGSSTSFEGLVFTDMAQIGDTMNITVSGVMADEGSNSRLTRLKSVPRGNIHFKNIRSSRNYIILDSDIPVGGNLLFEGCPNIEFSVPSTKEKMTGTISFKGCSFRRYSKNDSSGAAVFPNVKIEK
jgi:hypothetical protein